MKAIHSSSNANATAIEGVQSFRKHLLDKKNNTHVFTEFTDIPMDNAPALTRAEFEKLWRRLERQTEKLEVILSP